MAKSNSPCYSCGNGSHCKGTVCTSCKYKCHNWCESGCDLVHQAKNKGNGSWRTCRRVKSVEMPGGKKLCKKCAMVEAEAAIGNLIELTTRYRWALELLEAEDTQELLKRADAVIVKNGKTKVQVEKEQIKKIQDKYGTALAEMIASVK